MQTYDKGVIMTSVSQNRVNTEAYTNWFLQMQIWLQFPQMTCAAEEGSIPLCYFNYNNAFHLYFLYCEFYIIQTNIFH